MLEHLIGDIEKPVGEFDRMKKREADADPEILHGRWLMGWLPIVNDTGAGGWLVNNG